MKQDQIHLHRDEAHRLLRERRLLQALDAIKPLVDALADWHLSDRLEALRSNYAMMLRYMNASADPQRGAIHRRFIADAYALADIAADRLEGAQSASQYFSKRRLYTSGSDSLVQAADRLAHAADNLSLGAASGQAQLQRLRRNEEEALQGLFDAVRTSLPLSTDEAERLVSVMSSELLARDSRLALAGALTLGTLALFDEAKVLALANLADPALEADAAMRLRALTGLLLIIAEHPDRVAVSPAVEPRLALLFEDKEVRRRIRMMQVHLLYTREAKRIARKFHDEIIPDMLKASKKRFEQSGLDPNKLPDAAELEANPEWAHLLDEGELDDRTKRSIREITELQQEGADVMFSAFSNLKSFPFFGEASNWFVPFSTSRTEVASLFADASRLRAIERMPIICASDKYSLVFAFGQMPGAVRNQMLDEQVSAFDASREQLEASADLTGDKAIENDTRLYLQDIYRFFTLYGRASEMRNPFEGDLILVHHPLLHDLFLEGDGAALLAEICLRKGYWGDAEPIYRELLTLEPKGEYYQKLGYCLQQQNRTQEALDAYLQADALEPDSPWTLRRTAQCYRNLGRPADALAAYRRFARLKPDNKGVELNMGHCLLELHDYEGALTHYFKVDYLEPDSPKTLRPMAWCMLLTGRLTQAAQKYAKLIEAEQPAAVDLLNAGHAFAALGELDRALDCYRRALRSGEPGFSFEEAYLADKEELLRIGVGDTDFHLMLDYLLAENA
jgi:tetratricopeptide (TPR) repeat protein